MLKETKKLIEELNELKEDFAKEFGMDMLEDMSGKEFLLLKKCFNLMKSSEELMLEQAEMMDSMNEKLDRLIQLAES